MDMDQKVILRILCDDLEKSGARHCVDAEVLSAATGLTDLQLQDALGRLDADGFVRAPRLLGGLGPTLITSTGLLEAERQVPDEVRFEHNRDRRKLLELLAVATAEGGRKSYVFRGDIHTAFEGASEERLYFAVLALEGLGLIDEGGASYPVDHIRPTDFGDEVLRDPRRVAELLPLSEGETSYEPMSVEPPAELSEVSPILEYLGWTKALDEYQEASRHLADGDNEAAVNAVGRSLESTLVSFLEARAIETSEKDTLQTLISKIPRTFKQADADLPFKAVHRALEFVTNARNVASHGQQPQSPDRLMGPLGAVFVRNVAAATIIFLASHERRRRATSG